MRSNIKWLATAAFLAAAHLALTIVIVGKHLGEYSDRAITDQWKIAFEIVSFPLGWLERLQYAPTPPRWLDVDLFPGVLIANSLLWGAFVTWLVFVTVKRTRT